MLPAEPSAESSLVCFVLYYVFNVWTCNHNLLSHCYVIPLSYHCRVFFLSAQVFVLSGQASLLHLLCGRMTHQAPTFMRLYTELEVDILS